MQRVPLKKERALLKEEKEETSFAERLLSPCKVFHGTSADYVDAAMEDRGKGFWFTRNQIDAKAYAKRGNTMDGGQPRVLEAWVRMENALNLRSLYEEAVDKVLSEPAHDSHVRLDVLFQPHADCRKAEVLEPCVFEIPNNADVVPFGFQLLIDAPHTL